MKKLLTLVMFAALLLTVSCKKTGEEQLFSGPKAKVTFTVDAGDIATRAVSGTHGTATRLMVFVYLKGAEESYSYISAISKTETVSTWPTTVSLELARNETYKIVFWADEGTDAYTINTSTHTVTEASTTINGNLTNRDAYYKMIEVTPTGTTSESVLLVRPLAQVNVGTSDLDQYKASANYTGNIETKVVVKGVAPGLDLLTGAATTGDAQNLTFSYAASLEPKLTSNSVDYSYLALNYVLCPADATVTADVNIRKADADDDINAFTVSNMPIKPNYRTNVVGKLLTGTATYTVDVDNDFTNDAEKAVAPVFGSVDALNAYFATMADNSDNGDINPEEVILSAAAAGSTIYLPKIATNVVIRLNAVCNGKLTIEYAEGATDGQKPARIDFYASKLTNLEATVPASHFELITGSVVTEQAIVATNTTTFVIQKGARVGTVKIQQGNTNIAGEVKTVVVDEDATADGTNPVNVFVANTAAVNQITLNAPTDVVVEQPKDQIKVEATERKVAVYVNEGAANSSATAQNGGVIYVKATVPCTVTADGTSEAEDGSAVASTVIIESGAAGSAVVAENGGSIDLTAKDNCAVVSQGASDDPTPVPSNVTVTSATSPVSATTSDEGTVTTTSSSQDNVTVVENGVALIGAVVYQTLTAAFAAAVPSDVVKILKDYDASNEPMSAGTRQFVINKSITIDGQGHTVQTKTRGFGVGNVNNNLSDNIDVTFKDITILNPTNSGRCIDTRGKIGVLTLDNVVLSTQGATGQYTQPLTIGGNQSDIASININNSTIQTNEGATAYYAIITFNPVNMTISNSTIKGWACIYAKGPDSSAGSAGSTFTVKSNSNLVSYNCYSGVSNAFSAVEIEDSNVTVDITDSNIAIHNSGDQIQSIFGFPNLSITGCNLSLIGNNIEFDNTGSGSCALIVNQGSNTLVYSDNNGLLVGGGESVIDDGQDL